MSSSHNFQNVVKILYSLVINWDQTGIQYIHDISLTIENEGAKQVENMRLKSK